MIPSLRIETLEPRYSPARLIAGPLPAEFGATLDPEAQGEIVEELPPEIVIVEIPGQIQVVPQLQVPSTAGGYYAEMAGGSLRVNGYTEIWSERVTIIGSEIRAAGELSFHIDRLTARLEFAELVADSQLQTVPEISNPIGIAGDLSLGVPLVNDVFSGGRLLVATPGASLGSVTLVSSSPGFSGGLLSGSFPILTGLGGSLTVSGGTLNLSSYSVLIEEFAASGIPLVVDPSFEPEPVPVVAPVPVPVPE